MHELSECRALGLAELCCSRRPGHAAARAGRRAGVEPPSDGSARARRAPARGPASRRSTTVCCRCRSRPVTPVTSSPTARRAASFTTSAVCRIAPRWSAPWNSMTSPASASSRSATPEQVSRAVEDRAVHEQPAGGLPPARPIIREPGLVGGAGVLAGPRERGVELLPSEPLRVGVRPQLRSETSSAAHTTSIATTASAGSVASHTASYVARATVTVGMPRRASRSALGHRAEDRSEARVAGQVSAWSQVEGHWQPGAAVAVETVAEVGAVQPAGGPTGDGAASGKSHRLLEDALLDDVVVDVGRARRTRGGPPPVAPRRLRARRSRSSRGIDVHRPDEGRRAQAPAGPSGAARRHGRRAEPITHPGIHRLRPESGHSDSSAGLSAACRMQNCRNVRATRARTARMPTRRALRRPPPPSRGGRPRRRGG